MADPEGQRDVPESSMAAATTALSSSTLDNAGGSSSTPSGNSAGDSGASGQPSYWCYQCRKQVMVEAERSGSEQEPLAGVICTECRSGFVEAVSTAQTDDVRHQDGGRAAAATGTTTTRRRRRRGNAPPTQTLSLSEALGQLYPQQLVQVLQLLGQAARANDNNNSNNSEHQQQQDREGEGRSDHEVTAENDGSGSGASQGRVLIVSEEDQDDNHEVAHQDTNLWGDEEDDDGESDSEVEEGMQLRLEDLDSVDEDDEIEDEDDEDEWEEVEDEDGAAGEGENAADEVAGGQNEQQQSEEHHQDHHRRNGRGRREAHTTRGPRNLHRYLQELLQNLVGQNIEVRVEVPEYVGNPGDYVDARGFQLLMQQLAENDNSRRGAPPAAKSAVNKLPSILIEQSHLDDDSAVCAVCKDTVCLGEPAKQMPCLHLYHAECILPWLSTRNSCPVCRYELPTDDPEYEDQKQNQHSRIRTQNASSRTVRSSSEQSEHWGSPAEASLQASDVGGVVSGDVASTSREVEQEQQEVHSGIMSNGEGGDLQGAPRPVRLRRARPSSGRGWLLLTAGPVISMVGLVLVICLGNHFMGSSSSQQHTQPPRQQLQEPCLEQIAGSSDSQSRRRWWWLPFQQR